MPRQNVKFHQLKRPKIRQTWSKYNLYNLSRIATPAAAQKTFFQQKWAARAMTRGYHHPYIKEKHWNKMFDRRLPAVVPMDYRYLAENDGSEMAHGRGAGEDQEGDLIKASDSRRKPRTPYMHMTFHPLERRLDTAIWRALFASSTKQARQLVVHGAVTVNGQKMIHPGYKLNPGDMFQVEPEKVMFATGAKKYNKMRTVAEEDLHILKAQWAEIKAQRKAERRQQAAQEEENAEDNDSQANAVTSQPAEQREEHRDIRNYDDPKEALQLMAAQARNILDSKELLAGKRRKELRDFARNVRGLMSKFRTIEEGEVEETIEGLEAGLAEILSKIPQDNLPKDVSNVSSTPQATESQPTSQSSTSSNPQMQEPGKVDANRARQDAELLHAALERARENPVDKTKPYATPWRPRAFMSAFAFIPRYLEVNQNICSAVYLRHPVARPGLAEVPTPFHGETMGLVFNWYLRRR